MWELKKYYSRRKASLVSLCIFTYDESQTTQNDLLLLILLLGLMNLWRFTQYRQLSWVWYNVFIFFPCSVVCTGKNTMLRNEFPWRMWHKQILMWSKYHLHNVSFVIMQYWRGLLLLFFSSFDSSSSEVF